MSHLPPPPPNAAPYAPPQPPGGQQYPYPYQGQPAYPPPPPPPAGYGNSYHANGYGQDHSLPPRNGPHEYVFRVFPLSSPGASFPRTWYFFCRSSGHPKDAIIFHDPRFNHVSESWPEKSGIFCFSFARLHLFMDALSALIRVAFYSFGETPLSSDHLLASLLSQLTNCFLKVHPSPRCK